MHSHRFITTVAAVAGLTIAGCSEPIEIPEPRVTTLSPKSARSTVKKSHKIPGEWVIQFKQGTGDPRGLMLGMLQSSRATLKSDHLEIAGAFVARISDAEADKLRKHPQVRSVQQNMTVEMSATQYSPSWGLDRIDQRNLPMNGTFMYAYDGSGVHIYMVDSGIDPDHVDFGGRVSGGVSTVGDNIGTLDGCGHGTLTAGIAGGATYGVAKAAYIHPVKTLDKYCAGDVSAYVYGLDWIRNNHGSPAVATSSLYFLGVVSAVDSAVRSLVNSGVAFVAVAGNEMDNACGYSPASVTEAIVAAATDSSDTKAGFSSSGPCVDLFAPGVEILTAYYDYWGSPSSHDLTALFTGTSASAPFVAGAVAVYLHQTPSATPASIASYLSTQASPVVQYPGFNTTNKLLYAPAYPGGPNVSVTGPAFIAGCTNGTWTATASNGAAPFTYTWTVEGNGFDTGTNNQLQYTNSGGALSIFVRATATDANGASKTSAPFKTNVQLPGNC